MKVPKESNDKNEKEEMIEGTKKTSLSCKTKKHRRKREKKKARRQSKSEKIESDLMSDRVSSWGLISCLSEILTVIETKTFCRPFNRQDQL